MKLDKSTIPFFYILLLFSCESTSTVNQEKALNTATSPDSIEVIENQRISKSAEISFSNKKQTHSDTINKPPIDCKAYWHKVDSLNNIKYDLFRSRILDKSLDNKNIPIANLAFIQALNKDLQKDRTTIYSDYIIDQNFLAIFRIDSINLGIIGSQHINNSFKVINPEQNLIDSSHYFSLYPLPDNASLIHYPEVFDSVYSKRNNTINIYTTKRKTTAKITNFGYYDSECVTYYHYSISRDNIKDNDTILFGTKLPLELDFGTFPEIDSILKNSYAEGCYDCLFHYEPEYSFAKLKGVDDLYFTYTDTFPINNKFDFPARAIIMQVDDSTHVTLWSESVDLFGCSCL